MSLQIGLIVLLHVSGLVSSTPRTEEGLLDVMLASSSDGSLCQLMNECLTIHPIKIRLAVTDGITGTLGHWPGMPPGEPAGGRLSLLGR